MSATISPEVCNQLAEILQQKYGFATTSQLDKAVLEIIQKGEALYAERKRGRNPFSLSTMIRGLKAERREVINPQTAEADVQFLRTLTTGATPGSYLVPTISADSIIQFLETGGIMRAAGARIWDMAGVQKLHVPAATSSPQFVWKAQASQQTPTDAGIGTLDFDLKERGALTLVPNQLIRVSVPSFDVLLAALLGSAAAAHEDTAAFSVSTVSGGPTSLLATANITTLNCAGSANGGNLSFVDFTTIMAKAATVKAKAPFCWFMSPRTFWQRVFSMMDTTSRPLFVPTITDGLQQTGIIAGSTVRPVGMLLGYPCWISPYIPENQTLGSGTLQSSIIFVNPSYIHLAQDVAGIEIAVSTERYFDQNSTGIRATGHEDLGVSPPAGLIAMLGVN